MQKRFGRSERLSKKRYAIFAFKPSRQEIKAATEEYIKSGKIIKKIIYPLNQTESALSAEIHVYNADQFLMGL
jgi:hypothetical protein